MLARGSRGSDVMEIQKYLMMLGYNPGGITGYFDSRTEEAVLKLQSDQGLAVNGIVGPATITKINKMIKDMDLVRPTG